MALPTLQQVAPAILKVLDGHTSMHRSDVVRGVEDHFALTEDERNERIPSGQRTKIKNLTMWASVDLKNAELLERPSRGLMAITQAGRDLLPNLPDSMDRNYFMQFPSYQSSFMARRTEKQGTVQAAHEGAGGGLGESMKDASPEEAIVAIRDSIHNNLANDLLEQIQSSTPRFFEHLTLKLLQAMGYGGADGAVEHLGGPGDGGVDGVIEQDALGLDKVYVQAKRYQKESLVSPSAIQSFSGSLNMKQVNKGLFITTSGFTKAAKDAAAQLSQNIVLIDGEELAQLMIRYNVGCRVIDIYEIKSLDEEFFEEG